MFSGIVETTGVVKRIEREGDNINLTIACDFTDELKIDQSVAHNGVCLTVVNLPGDSTYTVTAVQETLDRSNLGLLEVGSEVNLERSMIINGRLDGHIVQGHVDCRAVCTEVNELDGSWNYHFSYHITPELARKGYVTVEKGSVAVNGVSLTVCNSEKDSFEVAIIPYTHEHTNFHAIKVGTVVNLEFDIIGKYIARISEI